MAVLIPIRAEMSDGRILRASADQRAIAATEAAGIPNTMRSTWVRHIAWAALKRAGSYSGTWDEFNENDCVEASDVPKIDQEEPSGADGSLDPGQPARRAGRP